MLTIALSFVLAAVSSNAAWYDNYATGVRLIEQGKGAEAEPYLTAAIEVRPDEGLQVRTKSQQYIDYLPHLYRAIARHMSGDIAGARTELAATEASGVSAKSEIGRPLLVAYQLLLRSGSDIVGQRASYAVYPARPPVLSEAEFNTLRSDVMSKCDLPPDTRSAHAPWYAEYEIGLELERKGDYPRALSHFIDAVAKRPNPERHARTYGVWLVDYYPYFHIARAHVQLQNWECAKNALDISQRLTEIPRDVPELQESLSLRRESERRISEKAQ